MFMPVGRNTFIYIPTVRHRKQQTEALVEQPISPAKIRVVRYGMLFITAMIAIGLLIAWYDSRH